VIEVLLVEAQENKGGGTKVGEEVKVEEIDEKSEKEDDDDHSQYRHGRRHRRGGNHEDRLGKLKFTIPKFDGRSDPEAYFTWELKVDKIFRLHNYSE